MSNKKIEQELLEILSSYDMYDNVYDYMNIIIDLNKKGINKKILTDILSKMLREFYDKESNVVKEGEKIDYGLPIDILITTLGYITKFCPLPPKDSPEGKFYYYFEEKE